METKLFEVRDRGTFIPVIATLCRSPEEQERYLLNRSGYGTSSGCIFVGKLSQGGGQYDPYSWSDGSRTMTEAHAYIEANWNVLASGEVIDLEFIKGESQTKKISERFKTL